MKNLYRNFCFTLCCIISLIVGFSGDLGKIQVKRFLPYLSIKAFLMLSVVLLICSLPDLVEMVIKLRTKNK
ncbi:hypothetical protein [Vagococcus lutrae]|uniref:hypothetical protein n=1 Tax=Vagococcus lutrae TaxID=81947 RepID=UPI002A813A89|nr:hypothetical protein [Vagococcus lutrae]MDY3705265.1 hypothetical protein [Vagococcus lutrae]